MGRAVAQRIGIAPERQKIVSPDLSAGRVGDTPLQFRKALTLHLEAMEVEANRGFVSVRRSTLGIKATRTVGPAEVPPTLSHKSGRPFWSLPDRLFAALSRGLLFALRRRAGRAG